MKKILLFVATHLAKVDALHGKVQTAYGYWMQFYELIKPLLPTAPDAVSALPDEAYNEDPAPAPVAVAQ